MLFSLGQPPRRATSTKQVSFATSQLLIDETGNMERQISTPQLQLMPLPVRGGNGIPPLFENVPYDPYTNASVGASGPGMRLMGSSFVPPIQNQCSPSVFTHSQYVGQQYAGSGGGGGNEELFGRLENIRSNIKLARIREWVLTQVGRIRAHGTACTPCCHPIVL